MALAHDRVRAAVLLAPMPPWLPSAVDNPGGVDRGVVGEFMSHTRRAARDHLDAR